MSLLWIVRNQHLLLLLTLHLITSLFFIYHGKNKLSFFCELLLVVAAICYNKPIFEIEYLICYVTEYLIAKALIIFIVWLAKRFSFYVLVVITHKNRKKLLYKFFITKKRFLRMQSHIWHKVNYGIRIKKGMPSMVNKKNSRTGIPFDSDGFPKFKVISEVKIERKYWKKERDAHFYRASKLLYEKAQKNAKLSKKFSRRELKTFKQGDVPNQYTWHHHQDKGVLLLVNREIHASVRHNGGFSIWGPKK